MTCSPATVTVPARGNCRPVASFIKVDLPQPDGPTTAANSPSSTEIDRPSTASAEAGAGIGVIDPIKGDESRHGRLSESC